MKKISIVIPVYNVEKYLRQCLNSVVNQTLKDIEIICVNDCSTDGSLSVLNEYKDNDSRVIIINNAKNYGLGVTRNIGQKAATGKYILFLDSDDYLSLDACEKLHLKIEKDKADAVFFNAKNFDDNCKKFTDKFNFDFDNTELCFNASSQYRKLLKMTRQVWYKIYNREYLSKFDIYSSEDRICEDTLFWLKFLLSNPKVSVLNEPFYFYRGRLTSLRNQSESKIDIIFDINNRFVDTVLNSDLSRDDKLIFIGYQIKWLLLWTNKKKYSKKLLCYARIKRKEAYKAILDYFSYTEIKGMELPNDFWKDLSLKEYGPLSIWYDAEGKCVIKLFFMKKLIK